MGRSIGTLGTPTDNALAEPTGRAPDSGEIVSQSHIRESPDQIQGGPGAHADNRTCNYPRVVQDSVFTASAMPGDGEARHGVPAWLDAHLAGCKRVWV